MSICGDVSAQNHVLTCKNVNNNDDQVHADNRRENLVVGSWMSHMYLHELAVPYTIF